MGFQRMAVHGIQARYRLSVSMISMGPAAAPRTAALTSRARQRDRRYGPVSPAVPARPSSSVSASCAAPRIGIYEPAAFAAFARTSRGVLVTAATEPAAPPLDWYYSARQALSNEAPTFHVRTLPLPRSPVGARAGLAFIDLVESDTIAGNRFVAVLVDRATEFVWIQPMRDLSLSACQDLLLAYHKLHAIDLLDIDVSAPPWFRDAAYLGGGRR
jgi:hypothetical protein